MLIALGFLVVAALGFGAGRVKHPANLKLSAVKAEIAKLEAEIVAEGNKLSAEVELAYASVISRLKLLL